MGIEKVRIVVLLLSIMFALLTFFPFLFALGRDNLSRIVIMLFAMKIFLLYVL